MNQKRSHIILDAMGGDYAPHAAVEGAVLACREHPIDITLVGNREAIMPHLRRLNAASGLPLRVHHTSQVIDMGDNPLDVVRKKKDSSIRVGLELVRDARGDAFVSAGNSGAVASGSVFVLKRLEGIDRPAIAAFIPALSGNVLLADAGASTTAKAINLVQFAVMASVYGRAPLNCKAPRIGLLCNGHEDSKGTDSIRDAHRILKESPLNYIGYVEGRDVFRHAADVVVCDGFSGNILIKSAEGLAESIGAALKQELKKSVLARIGAVLAAGAFDRLRDRFDYAEYGGAPLLGVTAPVVICHGRSQAPAIRQAVIYAAGFARSGAVREIAHELSVRGDLRAGARPSLLLRFLHDMRLRRDKNDRSGHERT